MKYLAGLCIKGKSKKFWPKKILYHSSDPKGVKMMTSFAEEFDPASSLNLL